RASPGRCGRIGGSDRYRRWQKQTATELGRRPASARRGGRPRARGTRPRCPRSFSHAHGFAIIQPMTAIRAIFDGKAFVPQQPVLVPPQAEALVLVNETDPAAQQALEQAVREYYQAGPDVDDEAWGRATAPHSRRAWDED